MFENSWQGSPAQSSWKNLITQKRQSFKLQIRNRQIQTYKNQVRQKYNIIINHSNPYSTTQQIKLAIAKKQYKLTYVMSTVSSMLSNYCFCCVIAKENVMEMMLIGIVDQDMHSNNIMESTVQQRYQLIQQWIDLVIVTTQYWPDLWRQLYQQSTQIMWVFLVEYYHNLQICQKIKHLLSYWKQKYSIQKCPEDQDIIFLLRRQEKLCPIILEIIGQHMNLKIQQTLQENNLILTNINYLDSPQHLHSYIYLLSKIGYVDKTILSQIFKKLRENRIHDKKLAIKVLFEQMYFTQDQLANIQQFDHQCKEIVEQLLNQDN